MNFVSRLVLFAEVRPRVGAVHPVFQGSRSTVAEHLPITILLAATCLQVLETLNRWTHVAQTNVYFLVIFNDSSNLSDSPSYVH